MIDRASLFIATFAAVVSVAAVSSQFSVWIVQELHKVGDQVSSVEQRVIGLKKKLKEHEENSHK
jgi:hypothetical protein